MTKIYAVREAWWPPIAYYFCPEKAQRKCDELNSLCSHPPHGDLYTVEEIEVLDE